MPMSTKVSFHPLHNPSDMSGRNQRGRHIAMTFSECFQFARASLEGVASEIAYSKGEECLLFPVTENLPGRKMPPAYPTTPAVIMMAGNGTCKKKMPTN